MKRIFLLVLTSMLVSISMSAQVYVNTNGNVGVRTSANDSYAMSVYGKNRSYGIFLHGVLKTDDIHPPKTGISVHFFFSSV